MNKSYCIVFNASLGVWVAASELARGRNKSGRGKRLGKASLLLSLPALLLAQPAFADDCATTPLSFAGGAIAGVNECYISGALQTSQPNDKVNGVDLTDSANYKAKNQIFGSDTRFSLSNDVKWLPAEKGPTTALPVTYVSAAELYAKGAHDGNGSKWCSAAGSA